MDSTSGILYHISTAENSYSWHFAKARRKQDSLSPTLFHSLHGAQAGNLLLVWSWSFWRGINRVFRGLTSGWPRVSQGTGACCSGKQEPRVKQLTFFSCFTIISQIKGDLGLQISAGLHDSLRAVSKQHDRPSVWLINCSQAELIFL